MHCWYRFRSFRGTTPREWVLRIRFKKFKFGTLINATDCIGGYMQVTKDTRFFLFEEDLNYEYQYGRPKVL